MSLVYLKLVFFFSYFESFFQGLGMTLDTDGNYVLLPQKKEAQVLPMSLRWHPCHTLPDFQNHSHQTHIYTFKVGQCSPKCVPCTCPVVIAWGFLETLEENELMSHKIGDFSWWENVPWESVVFSIMTPCRLVTYVLKGQGICPYHSTYNAEPLLF